MNRYDRARARVPAALRPLLEAAAHRVCDNARHGFHPPVTLDGVIEGRPLRVLLGVTESTLHISVSRTDVRKSKVGRSLPIWEDIVSVRACCWPDTVEVHQVLPALEGDDGERWLSVAEVLHLRGPVLGESPWASWEGRDPSELWRSLAMAPRPEDPQERAAAYLWLQGRTANNSPVWWEGDGEIRMTHRNGIGGPCEQHQPAALERPARVLPRTGRLSSGVTRPRTVSDRILAAGRALACARVDRQHPDPHEVSSWLGTPGDLSGVVVMLDPPYVGATRYEATCPRADVVALALAYRALGAMVIICEAEALPELLTLGWHGLDLRAGAPGKPEWLTCSDVPHHLARPQLALFGAA